MEADSINTPEIVLIFFYLFTHSRLVGVTRRLIMIGKGDDRRADALNKIAQKIKNDRPIKGILTEGVGSVQLTSLY
jgi:hypothetical protein